MNPFVELTLNEVKWTKTALADPAIMKKLENTMAYAVPTANTIKRRCIGEGRTATPPQPYRGSDEDSSRTKKRRSYFISPAYMDRIGAPKRYWKTSADFHAAMGVKPGSFLVSGGMWDGLQVRNYGADGAVIDFGGSSLGAKSTNTANTQVSKPGEGQQQLWLVRKNARTGQLEAVKKRELSRFKRNARDGSHAKGDVRYRATPTLVRNSDKAGTVFRFSRVGLLQPTDDEVEAIVGAAAWEATRLVNRCFDDSNRTARDGDYFTEIGGDKKLLISIINGLER